MFSDFIKKHKTAVPIGILVLIGLFVAIAVIAIGRIGKEPVEVYLLPADTILTANGERIGQGTAYLKSGEYTIKAERGGFKSTTKKVTIVSPNTLTIDIALEAESESAAKWAKENEQLYLDYEGRTGLRANERGETFSTANPITSVLPYENLLYGIGYRADTSDPTGNSIIIEIDSMNGYRNAAVEKIRDLGYDPTDFKINFRDYESPFGNE